MTINCPRCSTQTSSDGLCHRCLLQVGIELKQSSNAMAGDPNIPSAEELARSFPQLEIKRLVGRGGMGAIYQARQTGLDRDVAIKIIDRRISKEGPFLERFEREARALAKLSHPNIVTIYDYGQTEDGLAYLVMEYVNGLNLREAMEAMTIETAESVDYIKTMCSALHYAHSKGVVHRDIKPENILLGDDGSLKIADFGIAKIVDADSPKKITATQHVLGTPHYLAPEQLDSPNEVDHRVDIYAVGVVFYELLTRRRPVGTFEAPSQINPELGQRFDAIVLRTLNRRPSARYQSAEEMRHALEQADSSIAGSFGAAQTPVQETQFSTASVPFECDDLAGFAQARGTIQTKDDGIFVEYQVCDKFWGKIRSRIRTVSIPWGRILAVDYQKGVFSGKLRIVGDSISALQNFPRAETGRIEVVIERNHFQLAERLIESVQSKYPRLVSTTSKPWAMSENANYTLAILLVFFAIVNAGLLAIAQVVGSVHLKGWMLSVSAISSAVLLGPLVLVQLLTGILHAVTGNKAVAKVGVLTTMLPVSPLALFGIPFGVWARTAFGETKAIASSENQQRAAKGWGATTLVFMRDSRNARVISLLETIGCVVIFGAIGLFWFGLYPVTMDYRIVGEMPQSKNEVRKSLDARLQGTNCTPYFTAGGMTLRCWQFQKQSISQRLSLADAPVIQCLASSGTDSQDTSAMYTPILSGMPIEDLASRSVATGTEVLNIGKRLELDAAWVARVELLKPDLLQITMSSKGDEAIRKFTDEHKNCLRLGLVIDGWIEGLTLESARDRRLTFRMSGESKRSLTSIQAAIRGPALPFELELLD